MIIQSLNLFTLSILLVMITYGQARPSEIGPIESAKNESAVLSKSTGGSGERAKRQLFRNEIPYHRPLTGNLYAHHHGYPHPGRWHPDQQTIIPANYDSGLHFESPNDNVIITDDDFNRYGSTLQHIDAHRVRTNPQPILHEYPTEYAKVVPLDESQGHELPVQIPVIATHHHIHHHADVSTAGITYNSPTVVTDYSPGHGHSHTVGSSYPVVGNSYDHSDEGFIYSSISPPIVKSSKPSFFGFKLPSILSPKTVTYGGYSSHGHGQHSGGGLLKGLLQPRPTYKRRRHGSVSWSTLERTN